MPTMKVTLSPSDIFEIRNLSLISSKDYEYVLDLYAPIVGIKKVSVYFAMLGESKNQKKPLTSFLSKYHLSAGEFEGSLSYLEAVGLISSYQRGREFIFTLHSPRTPAQFFGNELLYGTLKGYLRDEEIKAISDKYQVGPSPEEGFENVSEKFTEIFELHFDGQDIVNGPATGDRSLGTIHLGFDQNKFAKAIHDVNPNFILSTLTKEEVTRVGRLSALYSYEESSMASFVLDAYRIKNPIGSRIDFEKLGNICKENASYEYLKKEPLAPTDSELHGDTPTARVIRSMDRMTSLEFLVKLQRGNKPAPSDVKLIETLITEIGLPQNVVNALIFHVLAVQDNALSSAYVTKLGASLVRAGVTSALDAMNYLNGHGKGKKKKAYAKPTVEKTKPESKPVKETEEDISDEEFESLFKEGGI